jgi:hypothetical protein
MLQTACADSASKERFETSKERVETSKERVETSNERFETSKERFETSKERFETTCRGATGTTPRFVSRVGVTVSKGETHKVVLLLAITERLPQRHASRSTDDILSFDLVPDLAYEF